MNIIHCPKCKSECNHFRNPNPILFVNGEDNYEADEKVRGNVVYVKLVCEMCSYKYRIAFGFHKGNIFTWID